MRAFVSFAVFDVGLATAFGDAWYRRFVAHFLRGERLAAREAELEALKAGLEARVAEQTAALRSLYARLETTRDEERRILSRELHDELGQELTALRLALRHLRGRVGADALPWVDEVDALLDRTRGSVRRLLAVLRPAVPGADLGAALTTLAEQTRIRAGVEPVVHLQAVPAPLAPTVYRIVQEALTNVCRHSGATQVRVDVGPDEGGGSVAESNAQAARSR